MALVALALYLPYAWVLGGYPWDEHRLSWIRSWPVLPGLLVRSLFFHDYSHGVELAVMGAVTGLLLLLLTFWATRGRVSLWLAVGVTLAGSAAQSFGAYNAFRA